MLFRVPHLAVGIWRLVRVRFFDILKTYLLELSSLRVYRFLVKCLIGQSPIRDYVFSVFYVIRS